jgi:hypothetical protein
LTLSLRSQTKAGHVSPQQHQQQQYMNNNSFLPDTTNSNNNNNNSSSNANPYLPEQNDNEEGGFIRKQNDIQNMMDERKPSLQSPSKPFHLVNTNRLYEDF